MTDFADLIILKLTKEGYLSSQKFICNDTNGPNVYFFIVNSLENFGSTIGKAASLGHHLQIAMGKFFHSSKIEIDHFNFSFQRIIKDIVRLNVSMTNSRVVKICYSF